MFGIHLPWCLQKNHLVIFSSFLDIWENVEWPRFFWTTRYYYYYAVNVIGIYVMKVWERSTHFQQAGEEGSPMSPACHAGSARDCVCTCGQWNELSLIFGAAKPPPPPSDIKGTRTSTVYVCTTSLRVRHTCTRTRFFSFHFFSFYYVMNNHDKRVK